MEDAVMFKVISKTLLLAAFLFFLFVIAGYMLYAAVIVLWTPPQTLEKHDAVVVLTGAKGRIETGFQLLLEDNAPTLLITGVLNGATLEDLIRENSEDLSNSDINAIRNHCCITLDRVADTTATNATESLKWIEDNDIQSIILVTSASHMPRAFIQFIFEMPDTVKITPYPYQAKSRIKLVLSPEFWHYAFREYMKFGGTIIRLLQ
jgi:uncharacterized SAM-binding protein YcdF (DUF218 family)